MKKTLLVTVLFCALGFSAFSQTKGYELSLSIGNAIPLGDFASKNEDKEGAGFANSGSVGDFRFSKKFEKNWGLIAMGRFQFNSVDVEAIQEAILKDGSSGLTRIETSSTAWINNGFMFGGFYEHQFGKLYIEGRTLLGFVTSTLPEQEVTATFGQDRFYINSESKKATSFSTNLGASLKYDIGKNFITKLNFDIFSTNPEFVGVETTTNLGTSEKNTFDQSISTFNISVGFGYRF